MGEAPHVEPSTPEITRFPPNAVHTLRTAQFITLQFGQLADQKASILMGATFVVFTISIGQMGSSDFAFPLMVLAFFSFVSALLAIIAILPKLDIRRTNASNLLFFGVFATMSEEEFTEAVIKNLRDEEATYRMMLRDIYQNGRVLRRMKYPFLAYSYRTFLVGLVLTFAAFVAQYLFQL